MRHSLSLIIFLITACPIMFVSLLICFQLFFNVFPFNGMFSYNSNHVLDWSFQWLSLSNPQWHTKKQRVMCNIISGVKSQGHEKGCKCAYIEIWGYKLGLLTGFLEKQGCQRSLEKEMKTCSLKGCWNDTKKWIATLHMWNKSGNI